MKISIIAPMFNEEENLTTTLDKLKNEMQKNPQWDYEIIFVNDGSTDSTWEKAKLIEKSESKLKVVGYQTNQGRGKALRTGFEHAVGDIIVTIDFDLSYHESHITQMINAIMENDNVDVVLASAYMPGGDTIGVPKFRLLISKLGNWIYRYAFSPKIYTSTCVVRAYRKNVVNSLLLESDDKEIHLEIISKVLALGYKIKEIPAVLTKRKAGKSKFKFKSTSVSHILFFIQEKPFLLFGLFGFLLMIIGFLAGIGLIYNRYSPDGGFVDTTIGRLLSPNFVIIVILFGLQLLGFGFLSAQNNILKKEIYRIVKSIRRGND